VGKIATDAVAGISAVAAILPATADEVIE